MREKVLTAAHGPRPGTLSESAKGNSLATTSSAGLIKQAPAGRTAPRSCSTFTAAGSQSIHFPFRLPKPAHNLAGITVFLRTRAQLTRCKSI